MKQFLDNSSQLFLVKNNLYLFISAERLRNLTVYGCSSSGKTDCKFCGKFVSQDRHWNHLLCEPPEVSVSWIYMESNEIHVNFCELLIHYSV